MLMKIAFLNQSGFLGENGGAGGGGSASLRQKVSPYLFPPSNKQDYQFLEIWVYLQSIPVFFKWDSIHNLYSVSAEPGTSEVVITCQD